MICTLIFIVNIDSLCSIEEIIRLHFRVFRVLSLYSLLVNVSITISKICSVYSLTLNLKSIISVFIIVVQCRSGLLSCCCTFLIDVLQFYQFSSLTLGCSILWLVRCLRAWNFHESFLVAALMLRVLKVIILERGSRGFSVKWLRRIWVRHLVRCFLSHEIVDILTRLFEDKIDITALWLLIL